MFLKMDEIEMDTFCCGELKLILKITDKNIY